MEIFDNKVKVVRDDLIHTIRSGSRISIAAACFSIYAYQELAQELEACEELRFIFTSPTFIAEKTKKERKEFYIPRLQREKSLYGTEFEVRLRNELKQKAVARECAEWIRQKVCFKSNTTREGMNHVMIVEDPEDTYTYMPMNTFTTVDLGCERGNNLTNMVTRMENPASTEFLRMFNTVWTDSNKLADVTEEVIEMISNVYQENSPELIYFMTLYHIFSEFLEDISEDVLPNEATGYRDSIIWKKLFHFQRDAAVSIINKLETYNGCILADSVGLGKTFTALAVIKYYEGRNKNVLVLCPKKLSENWMTYRGNLINNPLAEDRLRYDVLYHTDLSRDSGMTSIGLPIDRINWGNYDLVVIDESHNFRNGNGTDSKGGEKENRYMRLMSRIIRPGVKTKVLMLSATPVNNRFYDLRNQLALAYEGDPAELNEKLKTKSDIDLIFRQAQSVYNAWCKLPEAERTTQTLLSRLDYDFFELLDSVTIARSRKHIQTYYNAEEIGKFPERKKPITVRPMLTNKPNAINYREVYELLSVLHLTIYTPTIYIQPSKMGKYLTGRETENFRKGRELGIQRLMSINLLKRMESSVHSFLLTVTRIYELLQSTSDGIQGFIDGGSCEMAEMRDLSNVESDFDFDDQNTDFFQVGKKVQIDLRDMDYLSWKKDIDEDIENLHLLILMVQDITPEYDFKLNELLRIIREKISTPINPDNRKILIFTAFSDTAEYLYEHVSKMALQELGLHTALITGTVDGRTTIPGFKADMNHVLTCFSPLSKDKAVVYPNDNNCIDILVATDCISEGQNLQDCDYCINYDIHWNPVRIIQRFGRIDRIGSRNDFIQLVNFWPDLDLDEYINLKSRVETRMRISVMTSTGDDDLIYRLDAMEAYNKQLVKRIAVKGITESGSTATDSYLYLESINLSKAAPTATLQFEVKQANGTKRKSRIVKLGDNLYDLSNELEEYKGFVIKQIDGRDDSVEFLNGVKIYAGDVVGAVDEEQMRRIQIRETILTHIQRERELFSKGIKVLSLFFIDEVVKYREYDAAGQPVNGIYARMFEEEYKEIVSGMQREFGDDEYMQYLSSISAEKTHAGYFSVDGKGKMVDSKVGRKETTSDDVSAYELIMKNKELLLDRDPKRSPVRFIFSHSALREGWDNPNVFQICTLKQSSSDVRKRQEVGRGLRLCVNQDGDRMDANLLGNEVHHINVLTVIASESYDSFAKGLQSELAEAVADRPRKITMDLFKNKLITDNSGNEQLIDDDTATAIYESLIENGYVRKGVLTDKYYEDKANGTIEVAEEVADAADSVIAILDTVYDERSMAVENARSNNVELKVDEDKLAMPEFKKLWANINTKSVYVVDFDTDELIEKAIAALNSKLRVAKIYFRVEAGEMSSIKSKDELEAGTSFRKSESDSYGVRISANVNVKYDLVGKMVEETGLTRKAVIAILKGIEPSVFSQFHDNPEEFIVKAASLINDEKATAIIQHITYHVLDNYPISDSYRQYSTETIILLS